MVVILGLPRVASIGGALIGGLPGIAPLRLSGKKNGTVTGVGMIRSTAPVAPMPCGIGQTTVRTVTMKGSNGPVADGNWSSPRRRYGRASGPIQTSMGRKSARRVSYLSRFFSMQTATSPEAPQGVRQVEIGPERDGQRIDNALVTMLKGVPKSMIYRLLRTGQVRVNGKRAKPDTRLTAGDMLRIPPVRIAERPDRHEPAIGQVARVAESVIFEDKHFLVIDKPSGVASHGGSGVSHGAIELLRAARPQEHLELVHRLDRDTSGVLVLAKSRPGLTGLQAAIRDGGVTKQYLCLMLGHPSKAKFDVNAPLLKSVLQGGERMVRVAENGKPSLTFFREMEQYPGARLMQATLGTGRTHQIRVHAAHIGHPLVGDPKYGDREMNKRFRDMGLDRLFLHASHMSFELDGRAYSFSAPLPDDLKDFLDVLSVKGKRLLWLKEKSRTDY
jgi:23S rRNA pseudouridine955/2504/2580 synthase